MKNAQYESMSEHMKGFIQGLMFILIIIIIIAFFHFIGYLDRAVAGNTYRSEEDASAEYWNEEIETSDGMRPGKNSKKANELYEQRQKDFGSKSLNEKDREKARKEKEEQEEKSFEYFKK